MTDTHRIPVRVRGTVRGAIIDREGGVRLVEHFVSIQLDDREHPIHIHRVDGVVWDAPTLTLYVARDTIELSGHPGLESLGSQIVSSAFALPEFTRTMRSLGSRRGHLGTDHD